MNKIETGSLLIAQNPCVMDLSGEPALTVGDEYKVLSVSTELFTIIDDAGSYHSFEFKREPFYFNPI